MHEYELCDARISSSECTVRMFRMYCPGLAGVLDSALILPEQIKPILDFSPDLPHLKGTG